MSSPAARRLRWLAPSALVLALATATAWADFRQDYGKALEAYKNGKYSEAQALFDKAVADHPEPAARMKLYGMRFEPYVPQHYLGLIAAQAGDCGRARAQWGAAGNAAVVAEIGEAANEKCGGAIVQNRPPASTAAPAPAPAPAPAASPGAPPTVAAAPQRPVAAPAETSKPVVAPPPPVIAKVTPPPSRPPEAAPEKADKATPPDQLVLAFQNFLGGKLSDVARINPDAYADSRARFHAYLVRGGARFTLAKLSGDAGELEGARADVRAARQINGTAAPDGAVFSPRFRAFYAETR